MEVKITVNLGEIRGGWAAYCQEFRLVGHGGSREEAVESLKRSVAAYCYGLRRDGRLLSALLTAGVTAQGEGEGIEVNTA